jgi:predicted lipoprotein with Yx(FWY)xxD motif
MKNFLSLAFSAVAAMLMLLSVNVSAAEQPMLKDGVLVDASGMTLYTFDKDKANSGKSVCNGQCATLWPPLVADKDAKASGEYSVITRDDGTKQWAYDGMPLYLYSADKKAGDRSGDNVKNVWHVIKK